MVGVPLGRLGLSGQGVHPLGLGDLKGEHVDAISAIGGQVIELGRGRGYLNILDPGQAIEVAQLLEERGHHEAAVRVRADAHGRHLNKVVSLITISRNNPPTDQEQTILDRALRVLDDSLDGVPVLKDLLDVITAAPDELRQVALDRGDMTVYLQETRIKVGGRPGIPVQIGLTSIEATLNDTNKKMEHTPAVTCWKRRLRSGKKVRHECPKP